MPTAWPIFGGGLDLVDLAPYLGGARDLADGGLDVSGSVTSSWSTSSITRS
jgi:hypothetical protein